MSGERGRSAWKPRSLFVVLLFALALAGCSSEEASPSVAAEPTASGDDLAARVVALDPHDQADQAELAAIATGPGEASVRLLALRRLEAGAAPQLVATASAILSEPEPGAADAEARNLRVNALAALARHPEGEAATDAHLADSVEPWKSVALAIVADARGQGGVR